MVLGAENLVWVRSNGYKVHGIGPVRYAQCSSTPHIILNPPISNKC